MRCIVVKSTAMAAVGDETVEDLDDVDGGVVKLKVHRPDNVWPNRWYRPRRQRHRSVVSCGAAEALAALGRPQPADALVDEPARVLGGPSPLRDTTPCAADVENRRIGVRNSGASVLAGEGATRVVDRQIPTTAHARRCGTRTVRAALAVRVRGQKCPGEISLSMPMSMAWLTTNCVFGFQLFEPLAVVVFHATVLAYPAKPG